MVLYYTNRSGESDMVDKILVAVMIVLDGGLGVVVIAALVRLFS